MRLLLTSMTVCLLLADISAQQSSSKYQYAGKSTKPAARLGMPLATDPKVQEVLQKLPAGCLAGWPEATPFSTASGTKSLLLPPPIHAPPPHIPRPTPLAPTLPSTTSTDSKPSPTAESKAQAEDLLSDSPEISELPSTLPPNSPNSADPLSSIGPNLDRQEIPRQQTDPLSELGPMPAMDPPSVDPPRQEVPSADRASHVDPHAAIFADSQYPSSATCAKCHPAHYEEWRFSAHAYSAISPMFHRFEQKLTELSKGTLGNFCVRCHAPVAIQLGLSRHESVLDGPSIYREGITCVACHRVMEFNGKTNGERFITPGDIHQEIVGSSDGSGLAQAIADRNQLKLKLSAQEPGPGQSIHRGVIQFQTLSKSEFCAPCHQVAVHPGVGLEVVWAQYRAGPAAAKGQTCQDCHMGSVPGKAEGYACQSIATLNDKPWGVPRKKSYHGFYGPGVSLAHPGLFPHHLKADRWSPRDWLLFDWRSGWGTKEFEAVQAKQLSASAFPPVWQEADDRRDARKIIDQNLAAIQTKRAMSIATMEAAIKVVGPELQTPPRIGHDLVFSYLMTNISEGHNLPTGSLGAQPQLWLNVVLINPQGIPVWESGDLDPNGDLRDLQSDFVRRQLVPADVQLTNLQTKFLITNLKGTEREICVPVNLDLDPLPFLRPGNLPITVLNHPPLIRMEAHSLPPLGSRFANYKIPGNCLQQSGVYRLSARMRSRMEPPYFMRFCEATPEMVRMLDEQILDLQVQTYSFEVAPF